MWNWRCLTQPLAHKFVDPHKKLFLPLTHLITFSHKPSQHTIIYHFPTAKMKLNEHIGKLSPCPLIFSLLTPTAQSNLHPHPPPRPLRIPPRPNLPPMDARPGIFTPPPPKYIPLHPPFFINPLPRPALPFRKSNSPPPANLYP